MAASPAARTPVKPVSSTRSYLIWGALAICAVIATSASITLGIGASKGNFSLVQFSAAPPPPQPIIQKPEVSEFEVARLRDAVRALSEQRDQLNARIETLEHSFGDITASISEVKEHTALPPAAPAKETLANATPPIEAAPPKTPAPKPEPVAAKPIPAPAPIAAAPAPEMPHAVAITTPPALKRVAIKTVEPKELPAAETPHVTHHKILPKKVERAPRHTAAAVPHTAKPRHHAARTSPTRTKPLQISPPPHAMPARAASKPKQTQVAQILPAGDITNSIAMKTEFGVDLGGEISMNGLRTLWASIKSNHGKTLTGLRPIVRVREGAKPGTVELHLVAGPVPDAAAAARVCADLQHAGVACQTSEYDGQKLSLH